MNEIRGIRNRFAHGYYDVDYNIIFNTVINKIPETKKFIYKEISEIKMIEINVKIARRIYLMPELSRFQGMIIKMIFLDNEKHNKPHIHVYYGEYLASIGIDGELLGGSLPVKKLKLIQAWLILHEEELYNAWNKAIRGIPFEQIKPLN